MSRDRFGAFPQAPKPYAAAQYRDAGFLFARIGARATKLFSAALEPFGLRPKHFAVLNYLATMDGAMQRALVEGLWIDSSTMVTLIDDCERLGLAERRVHPDDRRAYAVFLTPQGRRVLAKARRAAREVEEQILAPFDEAERRQLCDLLVRAAGGEGLLRSPARGRAAEERGRRGRAVPASP